MHDAYACGPSQILTAGPLCNTLAPMLKAPLPDIHVTSIPRPNARQRLKIYMSIAQAI